MITTPETTTTPMPVQNHQRDVMLRSCCSDRLTSLFSPAATTAEVRAVS